jgi:hypothetical protein
MTSSGRQLARPAVVGLFGAASLMLFGFLYWRTAGYLASDIDDWLSRASLSRAAGPKDRRELRTSAVDPDGELPFVRSVELIVGTGQSCRPRCRRRIGRLTSPCREAGRRRSAAARRLSSGEIVSVA